ncbi:BAR domain protein [Paraphysoderma sedebokerense]|nr:BAR domain protein [Paraphysoderma sedebokerense]
MDKFSESFSAFKNNFTPLASQLTKDIGRGFGQVKQYAQEKLGTAEDVTELPADYKELERKVDALRHVHSSLLKLMKHDSFLPPAVGETFGEITRSVKETLSLENPPTSPTLAEHPQLVHPGTFSHAVAAASLQGVELIGEGEPLGAALKKYGLAQEKIGDARTKMDKDVEQKFTVPFSATLNNNIQFAMRARRNVQTTRLHLDAVKSRFKSAPPAKIEQIRVELEQAEDTFVNAVEEAQELMKRCIESPEPLRNLADLVNAQVEYYKKAADLLTELAPEIDEIQVAQEAMYRNQLS